MAHKIVLDNLFKADLSKALDYISQNLKNQNASDKLLNKLANTVSLLKETPMLFPLYHNDKLAKRGFRYTVISNYLLFYKVHEEDQTVELLRFIFGNRNITDIF